MLIHPQFDPVAIHRPAGHPLVRPDVPVGFILFPVFGRRRIQQPQMAAQGWNAKDLDDMLFFGVLGVILGGRLGYVLFYKPEYYLSHPLEIVRVWEGGMAFHGGFLGVIIAMWLFAKLRHRHWMEVTDFIAPMIPCGTAAGRIGNFINGELWGRPTTLPWGMVFPQAGDSIPRHPSQLYQFAGEGVALFIILWLFARKPRPMGAVSGLFRSAMAVSASRLNSHASPTASSACWRCTCPWASG